jgi:hypothetical protein
MPVGPFEVDLAFGAIQARRPACERGRAWTRFGFATGAGWQLRVHPRSWAVKMKFTVSLQPLDSNLRALTACAGIPVINTNGVWVSAKYTTQE